MILILSFKFRFILIMKALSFLSLILYNKTMLGIKNTLCKICLVELFFILFNLRGMLGHFSIKRIHCSFYIT